MKKFLVVVMVLSLASMANAGIVFSVDGSTSVDAVEILDVPSGSFTINIEVEGGSGGNPPTINTNTGMPTDGATLMAGGDLKVQIRGSSSLGTLDQTNLEFPSMHTTIDGAVQAVKFSEGTGKFSVGLKVWDPLWSVYASDDDYVAITGGVITWNSIGEYTLLDGLEFHCEGEGTVYVDLIAADDILYYDWIVTGDELTGYSASVNNIYKLYSKNDVIDTITVTQIPEPMTIALLGLGGLFLRRRR
jgi:hypothetical protein